MSETRKITFEISDPAELAKLDAWMKTKNMNAYGGAIGGRFTYSFTPTSLGIVIKVKDDLEQRDEIDLTDYSSW